MTKIAAMARRLLEHPKLPLALAVVVILLMLPALPVGLFGDDLIQRVNELTPAELPPRIVDTGFVARNSGQLVTVLNHLFGYVQGEDAATRARDYGIAPWWTPPGWTAALWRPLTAFTHWVDYRLYPNSPPLMHAQNIAWFAAAVFLAATLYRKIAQAASGLDTQQKLSESGVQSKMQPGLVVAGVAACLWLLDKDTYFPVMYVANRGFIISLVFGLLCLHAHIRSRITKSTLWMWLSALCLLLSLLANEGGASTLAFLLAYAIVLDSGSWPSRVASLLPAAVVVIGWRAVYAGCGFGVRNFPGYVDPGYAPLLFLKDLAPRTNALLGGQLIGIPPELMLALNPTWQMIAAAFSAGFSLVCALVLLPVVRQDTAARFWAVVMLLALVPAATVVPMSKNLAFVALGAFGVIAAFLISFATSQKRAAMPWLLRTMSWAVAVSLIAAHVVGAVGGRIALALASPWIPKIAESACAFGPSIDIGERDVVVINDPTMTCAVVPFDRAYRGQPLPKTIRTLMPGSIPFEVNRPNASTLILKAEGADLFACPAVGPFHVCYACKAVDDLLMGERMWQSGERVTNEELVAEILEVSPTGGPRSVAFHFDKPLESAGTVWLFFDWRRFSHLPFVLPRIGETIQIAGSRDRTKAN